MPQLGKILVLTGLGISLLGLVIWLFGNKLNWFGDLPGDVRYEGKNVRLFAPFMTMLLLSILFSLIMWVIRRFF
jgi:Zn-dependent protease with chaperone function